MSDRFRSVPAPSLSLFFEPFKTRVTNVSQILRIEPGPRRATALSGLVRRTVRDENRRIAAHNSSLPPTEPRVPFLKSKSVRRALTTDLIRLCTPSSI